VTEGLAGDGVDRDPRRIAAMFDGIAARYDLMNRLMTGGLDRRWRGIAASEACVPPAGEALDVCCGTGDLTLELARRFPAAKAVTGLDFSSAMLARAAVKAAAASGSAGLPGAHAPVDFVAGDLLALPFAAGRFAAVTAAFGVRNVPDLPRALAEMTRVTAAGGRVVILEITQPPGPVGSRFHAFWFDRCVPLLGGLVAGDLKAYSYLPASVRAFPPADELAGLMAAAGLRSVRYRQFGLGIIALHVGERSEESE
jgi:demethylmenaquinone methyltransferase/2-methoxy-6-polyprenyl-1,4-benzoquinol methylase